jgi:hypothetical protein
VRLAAALLAALVLAPVASAATTKPTTTVPLPTTSIGKAPTAPTLSEALAEKVFLTTPKVAGWLKRYPPNPQVTATFSDGAWTIDVFSGKAGEIAMGTVDDVQGIVTEDYTGPQVAWSMARGIPGAFGGAKINSYSVWLSFCGLFLLGLIDWRRLRSLRNLDLLVLLSSSVSLWFFNHGHVFAAVVAAYPPLFWLLARCVWIGWRDRSPRGAAVWPVWVLAGAAVFIGGFRIGLNVRSSNVIDVGYSGVIGAERISHGQIPYGNMPIEGDLKACGPADSSGEIRNRIQTNGRCESANPDGDTYGPVSYEAYLPGYWVFGWSGKWDTLPAVHATTILWDVLALLGMAAVGWRFGGERLAATLAFAWVAYPFTQYASSSNTNDLIQPALLIWAFFFATSQLARGGLAALAGWVKFASLITVPLWAGYPEAWLRRPTIRFAIGFAVATVAAFSIMFLEPSPLHALRVFYDKTFPVQIGRSSPFSLWDWGQYHAKGIPNLRWAQHILEGLLVIGALVLGWFPRRRSALQLAAFTAALLIGFEVVLTHWSWLYLPWFFPFAAFALLVPRREPEVPPAPFEAPELPAEAVA